MSMNSGESSRYDIADRWKRSTQMSRCGWRKAGIARSDSIVGCYFDVIISRNFSPLHVYVFLVGGTTRFYIRTYRFISSIITTLNVEMWDDFSLPPPRKHRSWKIRKNITWEHSIRFDSNDKELKTIRCLDLYRRRATNRRSRACKTSFFRVIVCVCEE